MTEGALRPHQTIIVSGDRIAAVGDPDAVEVPAGAVVIDGSGKYLIPGLWDMHTHLLWSTDATEHIWTEMPRDVDGWTLWERYYGPTLDLLVANGVTGIREMWGNLEVVGSVRREAAAGERLAPRIIVAGHVVDGPPARWPGLVVVSTPAEARDAVDSLFAAGAEFIKVRYRVRPDAYHAILERGQELSLPVVGHVPFLVTAAEASDAGLASIEHLTGVVEGCSAARDELIALNRQLLAALSAGERERADSLEGRFFTRMLSTQDSVRCRALLHRLARNGTWLVPTLVLKRGLPGGGTRGSEEPLLKYIHPAWLDSWTPEQSPYGRITDEGYAQRLRDQERRAEITGMAADEGVPIMSGTDTPNAYVFPGFALHDELELLVEAGLTPLQALQAATINPARFLNATDSLGTVEEGKLADLVLLDANPLEDISNTERIASVVLRGRYLDRGALNALLAGAERAAAHDSNEAKDAMGSVVAGADRNRALPRSSQDEHEGASRLATGALIGGVIGALGGLLLYEMAESRLCGSSSDNCEVSPTPGVTVLVGAAVGAAVGAVIGASSDSHEREGGPFVPGLGVSPRHGVRLHWAVPVGP